jgi:hypothetical protein
MADLRGSFNPGAFKGVSASLSFRQSRTAKADVDFVVQFENIALSVDAEEGTKLASALLAKIADSQNPNSKMWRDFQANAVPQPFDEGMSYYSDAAYAAAERERLGTQWDWEKP